MPATLDVEVAPKDMTDILAFLEDCPGVCILTTLDWGRMEMDSILVLFGIL